MSKPSNPAVIGGFVLGAIGLLVAGVILFGGSELFTPKQNFVTYFEGSVKGLRVGSNVLFRGVRVGYVTGIEAVTDPEVTSFRIPVTFQILPEAFKVVTPQGEVLGLQNVRKGGVLPDLIQRGLRAKLETESFVTGQLLIQLDFYPEQAAVYRGKSPRYPEIPSVPSDIQQVLERLQRFAASLAQKFDSDKALSDLQGILSGLNQLANSPDLAATLEGLNRLANSRETQALPGSLRAAADALTATLADTQRVVNKVDEDVGPLLAETRQALVSLNAALENAAGTLQEARLQLSQDGVAQYELTRTLEALQRTARSLRVLVDYLSQQPEALIRGKPDQEGNP